MNPSAHISRGTVAAAVVAATVVFAACGANGAPQKSGAAEDKPVTLTLQMPDLGDKLGTSFATAVERRSGGSVRVKVGSGYSSVVTANELRLAEALEAGREDVAYIPARAWSAAGIPAFQALLAPFAVTTDATAQALAAGPVARAVLAALPHGVVGLALVPAESRRILAVRPTLSPADFTGLRVRIVDDAQSASTFQALGATAVQGMSATAATSALARHRIDAVESAPNPILNNAYWSHARQLSGYAVFPKFQAIVVSRSAWERMTAGQQAAVREAALETVRAARAAVAAQEESELSQLCRAGTRIAVPTAQQLQQLAAATQPATLALTSDAVAARVLAAIRKLPGAGPQSLASPLPAACSGTGATRQPKPKATAFPQGTYVAKVTPAQFRATGANKPKFLKTWTLTTRFSKGRWTQLVKPEFPDECPTVARPSFPACGGTYEVNGDELTLNWTQPSPAPPETMRWSYFDGVLRLQPVDVSDTGELAILGQPWRKVG
jgi:TRAP-type C4-dicarboxylate transport system substrate-binding protein